VPGETRLLSNMTWYVSSETSNLYSITDATTETSSFCYGWIQPVANLESRQTEVFTNRRIPCTIGDRTCLRCRCVTCREDVSAWLTTQMVDSKGPFEYSCVRQAWLVWEQLDCSVIYERFFQPAARCHANVAYTTTSEQHGTTQSYFLCETRRFVRCLLLEFIVAGSRRQDDIECVASLRAARYWQFHAKPTPENTFMYWYIL